MIKLKSLLKEQSVKINKEFNDELIDRINDEYGENFTADSLTCNAINDGYCDIWSQLFTDKFGGKRQWSVDFPIDQGVHHWVNLNNKYYDAEAPEGVSSIEELPFIKRAIQKKGRNWLNDIEIESD